MAYVQDSAIAAHSPIKLLPPEILVSIFQLVISSQECICRFTGSPTQMHILAYPDILVHVCSSWRNIGTNSPILWIHIDLLTNKSLPLGEKVIGRAEIHAQRARELPLDIHLPSFPKQTESTIDNLSQFLSRSSIAAQARSLDVTFGLEPYRNDSIFRPLSEFIRICKPGTLTALNMWSNSIRIGHPSESSPLPLGLPKEDLENLLLPITSLTLHLLYFPWSSTAYHGLVELRLTGYEDSTSIPESSLANMLRASPKLRVFEFGLHIKRDLPRGTPTTPIQLTDLEVLNLNTHLSTDRDFLLWRLVPGSKTLYLSLPCCYSTTLGELAVVRPFLACSNITTLHAVKFDFYCTIVLVWGSPKLQTLVIDRLEDGILISGLNWKSRNTRRLESVYLLDSHFTLEELVTFLALCPTRRLVLWRTSAWYPSKGSDTPNDIPVQALSRVCGDVQWLDQSAPSPIKDWSLFTY